MFVKFSNQNFPNNSVPAYINPDHVTSVTATDDGVNIRLVCGRNFTAQYDIEDVVYMLGKEQ